MPKRTRVAVVYHYFAAYREPVLRELMSDSREYEYIIVSDVVTHQPALRLVDPSARERPRERGGLRWEVVRNVWLTPTILWQRGVLAWAFRKDITALVLLGDPHFLSTWVLAGLARLARKRVLFWTLGPLGARPLVTRWVRTRFLRSANGLLLYGHRARNELVREGYDPNRLYVVYNSLDVAEQTRVGAGIDADVRLRVRSELFPDPWLPALVYIGRLVPRRRLDWLVRAVKELEVRGEPANLLLVGEGPTRGELEALASELGVSRRVCLYGACHNEERIGQLLSSADLCVAPAGAGLSIIHAMGYGLPCIIPDDVRDQPPECEAVVPGVTGAVFRHGSLEDMTSVIRRWLGSGTDRDAVRAACVGLIRARYNPVYQAQVIDAAVAGLPASRVADPFPTTGPTEVGLEASGCATLPGGPFGHVRRLASGWRSGLLRGLLGLRGLHPSTMLQPPRAISRDVIVGPYGYIGPGAWICPNVVMGKYVLLAPEVSVLGGDHCIDKPGIPMIFSGRPEVPKTVIEDDVWVGFRAMINAGVTVGRGSIVAAGARVTRDVPPYTIVGGVPARAIGARFATDEERARHDEMLRAPARAGAHAGRKHRTETPVAQAPGRGSESKG